MSEPVYVTSETSQQIEVTPEIAAKAFAAMDTAQQCAFFKALYAEVKAWPDNVFCRPSMDLGEWQWCAMWSDRSPT